MKSLLRWNLLLGIGLGMGCAAEAPDASPATACELKTIDDLHPALTMDEQLCELIRVAAPGGALAIDRAGDGSISKVTYVNPEEELRIVVEAGADGRPATQRRLRNLLVTEEQLLHYDGDGRLVRIERHELGDLASTVEFEYQGDRIVARRERDPGGAMLDALELAYGNQSGAVESERRNASGQVVATVSYEHQGDEQGPLERVLRRDADGALLEEVVHEYVGGRLATVERRDGQGSLLGAARYSYVGDGALGGVVWLGASGESAAEVAYAYDGEGRVATRTLQRGGSLASLMRYSYDGSGTLVGVVIGR